VFSFDPKNEENMAHEGLMGKFGDMINFEGLSGVEGEGEVEGDLKSQNLVLIKLLNMQKMKSQLDG
jgi:hypothetical protein